MNSLAERVAAALIARRAMLVTAESCTGGWVSQVLTAIAGSSAWFERGLVTYSNAAKEEMLGVRRETLARHGAVSEPVAEEMAQDAWPGGPKLAGPHPPVPSSAGPIGPSGREIGRPAGGRVVPAAGLVPPQPDSPEQPSRTGNRPGYAWNTGAGVEPFRAAQAESSPAPGGTGAAQAGNGPPSAAALPGAALPGAALPGAALPGTGLPGAGLPGTGTPVTGTPGTGSPGEPAAV